MAAGLFAKLGRRVLGLQEVVNPASPNTYAVKQMVHPQCDLNGYQLVSLVAGGVLVGDKDTRVDVTPSLPGTVDNIGSASFTYAWNPTDEEWFPIFSLPNDDDVDVGSAPSNSMATLGFMYGFNGSDTWSPISFIATAGMEAGFNNKTALVVSAITSKFSPTAGYVPDQTNQQIVLLASAARTALTDSDDQNNYNLLGGHFIINVTALAGGGSITPVIQGKDAISGNYYDILVGAAISATGMTVLKVHPGISPLANASANDFLPKVWRLEIRVGGVQSYTYSVSANLSL